MVLHKDAGKRILPNAHDLALVRAMLHTSPRSEEIWVDQEKRVRHVLLWVGGILMVWLVVLVLIRIGYAYQWTGFAERTIWN